MDFRQRLEQTRARPVDSETPDEADDHFACPYFATDRTRNPLCLDLRLSKGTRKALPYAYFTEINFDAEAGIEIITSGKKVTIIGRNLAQLFEALIGYRVRYVQANISHDTLDEDGLFVKDICIEYIG
jgi:hypothetical protein